MPCFLWQTMTFARGFIHSTWLPRESQRLSRGSRLPACSCWSDGWALWQGAMLTGSLCDSRLSAFLTRALQEPGKTLWFQCGFHTEYPAPPNGCRIGPRGGFCEISWFSVSSTRWRLCQWPNQGTVLFTCIFILNLPARNQHKIKMWILHVSCLSERDIESINKKFMSCKMGGRTHSLTLQPQRKGKGCWSPAKEAERKELSPRLPRLAHTFRSSQDTALLSEGKQPFPRMQTPSIKTSVGF